LKQKEDRMQKFHKLKLKKDENQFLPLEGESPLLRSNWKASKDSDLNKFDINGRRVMNISTTDSRNHHKNLSVISMNGGNIE
jgi:hypothetical protein